MSDDELRAFKDARLVQLEAHYSRLHYQNYRLWQDLEAQGMNLKGLMPQFEAATVRLRGLEAEVLRLRQLVPEDQWHNAAAPLVLHDDHHDHDSDQDDLPARLRKVFGLDRHDPSKGIE
jgi:hypothetical protein